MTVVTTTRYLQMAKMSIECSVVSQTKAKRQLDARSEKLYTAVYELIQQIMNYTPNPEIFEADSAKVEGMRSRVNGKTRESENTRHFDSARSLVKVSRTDCSVNNSTISGFALYCDVTISQYDILCLERNESVLAEILLLYSRTTIRK